MEKHCHPSSWPEPKALSGKILTPQEMVQKNKEGMSYSLIFNHGIREMPADERFKSMAKLSITKLDNIESFNKPERSLERAKDKKDKEDIDLAFRKQTQARIAAAYQTRHVAYTLFCKNRDLYCISTSNMAILTY